MKRVGIMLHAGRDEAAVTGRWLAERLANTGIAVHALAADASRLQGDVVAENGTLPADLELLFVLGGDGTLLRAAELVAPDGIPLLGVNLGRLGFLSELERSELESGLARILTNGFQVEERMVLQGVVVDGDRATPLWAMNDVIVEKVAIGRAIRFAVSIGGEPFLSVAADGVIIATPTGSTAYSFSSGGPVVSPLLDCLVVTLVSPHGLFDRSLVVPPDEEVIVHLLPQTDDAALSADGGPALPLSSGAQVHVRAGANRIRLAKVEPAPFWRLVRNKFQLPSQRPEWP